MRENGRTGEEGKERAMKKGLRGLACLLALAVLLLALPTGASAETWTADWTGSTMFTLTGTISNGSIILVAELYQNLGKIYINGVHGDSGPLGDLVIPTIISGANYNITLSARAFSGSKTLTSITASSAVSSIQSNAFQNCANLVYADLSACTNMTNVNQELFEGCTSLETVILPSSIKEIYGEAFRDCSNLNTIYILSKDPPTFSQSNYFYGCPDGMKIVIVNGDVATYKAAPGWNFYADQIVGGSLLTASPASKAWTVQRGDSADAQTFTLTNKEGSDINSLSVTLTGTDAKEYFELNTGSISTPLSVGASTNFTVTPKTDLPTGTCTAHVQVKSGDVIYATIPLTLTVEGAPLTDAQVEVENSDSIYYTGLEQQPNVTVTLNDNPLTENRDYTLSYSNNTNAGEATVTVTGKGDYSKTATGTFTIQPATLTITDAELSPKTYDGTTAATVTSVDFDGLVNGEKLDSGTGYTATAVFDDANAGEGKTATVTVELKNTNYTFAGGDTAEHELTGLTIAPCPVTVTPDAKSKAYGQSDPALTYTVSGLASGDSLMGALSRAEGENVGSYLIGQATLTDANNPKYAITFDGTKALTIEKADVTLTVTVDPASQKAGNPVTVTVTAQNAEENLMDTGWDQPDGNVTVTVDGEPVTMTPNGNTWTGTYTIPASTPAGSMTFLAEYAGNGNYNDKTNTATLTVNDKGAVTVTLTPSASSVTYGDSVTLTADVAKADPGDQDALTGTVQFYLDHIDEAGKVGDAQDIIDEKPSVTLDRAKLTAGSHTVYAVYEGNNAFATAQAKAGIEVDPLTLAWDASELTASRSQAQSGEATVYGTLRLTGALEGDSVTLTPDSGLVTSGLDKYADPGQYPVRVVPANGPYSLDNQNYALPADAPTITAVVHASTEEDVPTTGGALLKLIVEEGLSGVPAYLADRYASPAALEAALRADLTALGVPEANIAVYDATLWVSKDSGQSWTEAAEADFPASGLTVTVPYPAGTGAQGYVFTAAHMFAAGANAGDIEYPAASAAEKGVSFPVAGLSPVAVGWTAGSYAVTLHPSGGTIAQGKDVTAYTYGVGATLPTAADVTRDLYTFAGWYDNEAFTGNAVAAITPTDAGNKEYWAKWNLIPGDLPVFTEPSGPKEVTVQPGAQATLTASATGATVCQWYVNRGDGAGYVAISGATAMTYTTSPVTLDNDGYTYYCEATNLYGTARSAVFTLRVREPAAPPQTGDSSHTGLWVALMLLSLGGLGALGLGRRRQSGKR